MVLLAPAKADWRQTLQRPATCYRPTNSSFWWMKSNSTHRHFTSGCRHLAGGVFWRTQARRPRLILFVIQSRVAKEQHDFNKRMSEAFQASSTSSGKARGNCSVMLAESKGVNRREQGHTDRESLCDVPQNQDEALLHETVPVALDLFSRLYQMVAKTAALSV
jgi:hypothetical protein